MLDQILLLGSIVVPLAVSLSFFAGWVRDDEWVGKLACLGFGFPCLAGILLFIKFDGTVDGYCFEILYEKMGLQELGITFHLGLNGVSSPFSPWPASWAWRRAWPPSSPGPRG